MYKKHLWAFRCCSWEYVMGALMDSSGNLLSGVNSVNHSLFNGSFGSGGNLTSGYSLPLNKYYDSYLYSSLETVFTHCILGDATGELGSFSNITYANEQRQISSWYSEYSHFINKEFPWFMRDGGFMNGSMSGIFAFRFHYGSMHNNITFRMVFTP